MNYVLLFVAVGLFVLQTLCFKEFSRIYMKDLASYFTFNSLYFVIVVVIMVVLNTKPQGISLQTLLIAVPFGILFVVTILLYMKAMEHGPLSFSSLLFSFGLLMPILYGALFYHESISLLQIAALMLLFLTFYLGSVSTESGSTKFNAKWLLLCIWALIGNGLIMVLSKAHQMLSPGREVKEFLIVGFGTAAVLSLFMLLRQRYIIGQRTPHLTQWKFVLLVLGAGITTAFGNQIVLELSGRLPAIIQFPVVNGGIVLISSILSVLVFREKLTRIKWMGLALGLMALVLICLH